MNHYWAKFESISNNIFRFDTRIYLNKIKSIEDEHFHIGAIVGKNPGSAKQSCTTPKLQPVQLKNDKLLPNVLSIIHKSYKLAGIMPPDGAFIQVLNLFYLCNKDLEKAINAIQKIEKPKTCETEKKIFPWIWYLWGAQDCRLSQFKARFNKTKNSFFYDKKNEKVALTAPNADSFARHTQGLKHDLITPYISNILRPSGSSS